MTDLVLLNAVACTFIFRGVTADVLVFSYVAFPSS